MEKKDIDLERRIVEVLKRFEEEFEFLDVLEQCLDDLKEESDKRGENADNNYGISTYTQTYEGKYRKRLLDELLSVFDNFDRHPEGTWYYEKRKELGDTCIIFT